MDEDVKKFECMDKIGRKANTLTANVIENEQNRDGFSFLLDAGQASLQR
jgi:hypothetical protein